MTKAKMFKWLTCVAVVALLAGLLVGCAGPNIGPQAKTGLRLIFEPEAGIKQMLPALGMTCATYSVELTGTASLSLPAAAGNRWIEDLLPGPYHIAVKGWNADATPVWIGSGSADETVLVGDFVTVNIEVRETPGVGVFDFSLAWEPSIIANPNIVSSLTTADGEESDPALGDFHDIDPMMATAHSLTPGLPNAWYLLVTQIFDSGVLSTGMADVVRIVADQTTFGSAYLHAVEGMGIFDLRITPIFADPLTFTVFPVGDPFGDPPEERLVKLYESREFSVTENESTAFMGSWYLNGSVKLVDSPTYTLDPGPLLDEEVFRLDFIAWGTDATNQRAGSTHWIVQKEDWPTNMIAVRWLGSVGKSYEVSLINKANGAIVKNVVVTTGALKNELEIPDVATGINHALRVREYPWSAGKSVEYFQNADHYSLAQSISVPIAAPTYYDLETLAFTNECDPYGCTLTFTALADVAYIVRAYYNTTPVAEIPVVASSGGTKTIIFVGLPAQSLKFACNSTTLGKVEWWQEKASMTTADLVSFPVSAPLTLAFGTIDY